MNLADIINTSGKRMAAPLIGYPGRKLNGSIAIDNLKNASVQYNTIVSIINEWEPDTVEANGGDTQLHTQYRL